MDGNQLMLLGLGIVVIPFVFLLFLAIGPLGWLLVGAVVFLAGIAVKRQEDAKSELAVSGVNCPACGSRNDGDNEVCHYCGATLETTDGADTA